MSPVPRLSTEHRIRAVVWHEEEYICNKIALKLKVARFTAHQKIQRDWWCRGQKGQSSKTVRRRLVDSGLKYCRAKKKPLLSEKARTKRLDRGRQHQDYDWSKVIFSDESRFCLISDRPVYVTRRSREEYLPQCLNPTVKHRGNGIIVCGCITSKDVYTELRVQEQMVFRAMNRYKDRSPVKSLSKVKLSGLLPSKVKDCGGFSFISACVVSSIADREICIKSGLLAKELWGPGDAIMADSEFTISDLLEPLM
eukprot:gene10011-18637_t